MVRTLNDLWPKDHPLAFFLAYLIHNLDERMAEVRANITRHKGLSVLYACYVVNKSHVLLYGSRGGNIHNIRGANPMACILLVSNYAGTSKFILTFNKTGRQNYSQSNN